MNFDEVSQMHDQEIELELLKLEFSLTVRPATSKTSLRPLLQTKSMLLNELITRKERMMK